MESVLFSCVAAGGPASERAKQLVDARMRAAIEKGAAAAAELDPTAEAAGDGANAHASGDIDGLFSYSKVVVAGGLWRGRGTHGSPPFTTQA